MTTSRGLMAFAAAALVLVAVGACADAGDDPPTSPAASPSPSSPTTDTPTPPSESELAAEAAEAKVRQYYETVGQIRQDPKGQASDLYDVASGTQLLAQKNLLKSQRADGLRQTGITQVVELEIQSVSLDAPATAIIDVCWDVRNVDVIDRTGQSVVSPDRKDVGWTRLTVTNVNWKTAPSDGWRVSGGSDLEHEPCAVS